MACLGQHGCTLESHPELLAWARAATVQQMKQKESSNSYIGSKRVATEAQIGEGPTFDEEPPAVLKRSRTWTLPNLSAQPSNETC